MTVSKLLRLAAAVQLDMPCSLLKLLLPLCVQIRSGQQPLLLGAMQCRPSLLLFDKA